MDLKIQSTPTVDVKQAVPNVQAASTNCDTGDCITADDGEFSNVLNTELEALVDAETVDSEALIALQTIKSESDSSVLEISEVALTDITSLDDEPNELLALVDPVLQNDETNELLALVEPVSQDEELSDELGTLFQPSIVLVDEKQPKLSNNAQQEGQLLPPQGTLLPPSDETIPKNESADVIKLAPVVPQHLSLKDLSSGVSPKDSSLSSVTDLAPSTETDDAELSLKNMLDKSESNKDGSSDKQLLAELANKNALQNENGSRTGVATEAVSTLANNILGANQASTNTPTASAIQTSATLQLPQNPSPQQWGTALGDKVQWMINTKMDSAEMRIDPPHLGKMNISIKMTDDGAQVVIQTQHAATRDLVDAASYRLKEMLEQAGHEQVNVDVSHKESNQSDSQFSQNDEHDDVQNSLQSENSNHQDTINNDVIARAFNSDRPVLDLFA